jgi:hypothetical protein
MQAKIIHVAIIKASLYSAGKAKFVEINMNKLCIGQYLKLVLLNSCQISHVIGSIPKNVSREYLSSILALFKIEIQSKLFSST